MTLSMRFPALHFATPRKLPRADHLNGRVVVLDVAFASEASGGGFEKITRPFIEGLGIRLAAWIDHHDHLMHATFARDPRFVLSTKAEHGACPEMVTREQVARAGEIDTIVCHTDFDGLASAAKWIRQGVEPYPGADDDAHAIDTLTRRPSKVGERIDRALRAKPKDFGLFGLVVRNLAEGLTDPSFLSSMDEVSRPLLQKEDAARKLAQGYRILELSSGKLKADVRSLAFIDATPAHGTYDKTELLLLGQSRANIACVVDRDTMTFAAPFESGVNFLHAFDLSGGMPTVVSVPKKKGADCLRALGAAEADCDLVS